MSKYYCFNGITIELSTNITETFSRNIQNGDKKESGGILIGSYIKETNDIIIDSLTEPQPSDVRERYLFIRKEKKHKEILDATWYNSAKTSVYFGEWHTHPEDIPTPSSQDIRNWKKQLRLTKFYGHYLFFVIVGRKETRLWYGDKRDQNIHKLEEKSQ